MKKIIICLIFLISFTNAIQCYNGKTYVDIPESKLSEVGYTEYNITHSSFDCKVAYKRYLKIKEIEPVNVSYVIKNEKVEEEPSKRFWDYEGTEYESKFGVFLANDEIVAYDFLDSSDDYWDLAEEYEAKYDKELEIVVFAINTSDLNLSKLSIDTNNDSEDLTYFYDGVIPYTAMKKIN